MQEISNNFSVPELPLVAKVWTGAAEISIVHVAREWITWYGVVVFLPKTDLMRREPVGEYIDACVGVKLLRKIGGFNGRVLIV